MEALLTQPEKGQLLKADWINTPIGPMVAIGDQTVLYLLEFMDLHRLEREMGRLRKELRSVIIPGKTVATRSIEKELNQYFEGDLVEFLTPIKMIGTPFQQRVWLELKKIPIGETRSYSAIAQNIESPRAVRAVGSANGANQLAIVVPCHRVLNYNGQLGGYGGGLARKKWLLDHEAQKCSLSVT